MSATPADDRPVGVEEQRCIVRTIISGTCTGECDPLTHVGRDDVTYELCRNCPKVLRVTPIEATQ